MQSAKREALYRNAMVEIRIAVAWQDASSLACVLDLCQSDVLVCQSSVRRVSSRNGYVGRSEGGIRQGQVSGLGFGAQSCYLLFQQAQVLGFGFRV